MSKMIPRLSRLRYGVGEDFTAIGALKASAKSLGHQASYPWLMGISGAAFRLYWSQDWSLDMANYITQNVVGVAAESIGLLADSHMDMDAEEAWMRIKASVDSGAPALSCGLTSPFESCIIAGYEDNPRRLLVRGYLDEGDDYSRVPFRPWFGWCHNDYGLMPLSFLHPGKDPDIPLLIRQSMECAVNLASEGRIESPPCSMHGTRHVIISGADAYVAWAGAMAEKPTGDAAHRGFATSLNMNQLIDSRTAAQNYLLDLCNRVRPAALLLSRAAEHYTHEILVLKRARELIPYPQATPEKAAERLDRLFQDDERREQYARFLRTAREEDIEALGWIRKVIEGGIL